MQILNTLLHLKCKHPVVAVAHHLIQGLFECCLLLIQNCTFGHKNQDRKNFIFQDKLRRPEIDYGPVRNDPRCGLNSASRSVAQRRIVGGTEAGFGSFPWQAYIRIGKLVVFEVGGTLSS